MINCKVFKNVKTMYSLSFPQEKWFDHFLCLILLWCWRCLFIPHSLPTSAVIRQGFSEIPLPFSQPLCPLEGCWWLISTSKAHMLFHPSFQLPQLLCNEDSLIFLSAQCLCLGVCDLPGVQCAKSPVSNCCFYLTLSTHAYGSRYLG